VASGTPWRRGDLLVPSRRARGGRGQAAARHVRDGGERTTAIELLLGASQSDDRLPLRDGHRHRVAEARNRRGGRDRVLVEQGGDRRALAFGQFLEEVASVEHVMALPAGAL
jgi:hypothetical protein